MNSKNDDMTNTVDLYPAAGKTAFLPFESIDYEKAGIRLLPAQLARVCGVSKQAVSVWIKKGRIVLGSDGRVDPRQAFDRLAATGDISKLRMKILEPFRKEIAELRGRVDGLEVAVASRDREIERLRALVEDLREQLAVANEDAEFEYASALGTLQLLDDLQMRLRAEWLEIQATPGTAGLEAIVTWINEADRDGSDQERAILDYLQAPDGIIDLAPAGAPATETKGGADVAAV